MSYQVHNSLLVECRLLDVADRSSTNSVQAERKEIQASREAIGLTLHELHVLHMLHVLHVAIRQVQI